MYSLNVDTNADSQIAVRYSDVTSSTTIYLICNIACQITGAKRRIVCGGRLPYKMLIIPNTITSNIIVSVLGRLRQWNNTFSTDRYKKCIVQCRNVHMRCNC